jgi:prepilin peptidase CpaA
MALNAIPIEVAFIVLVASSLAALTDVWRFKVYNLLTLPVILGGMLYHTALAGWSGLALSAAGAAFGLAVFSIPYVMGGVGAGDVKFVVALGAWLGIAPLSVIVFIGCLATGVYALVLTWRVGGLRQLWFNCQLLMLRMASVGKALVPDDNLEHIHDWTENPQRRRRLIPLTAMMAIGALVMLVVTYAVSHR